MQTGREMRGNSEGSRWGAWGRLLGAGGAGESTEARLRGWLCAASGARTYRRIETPLVAHRRGNLHEAWRIPTRSSTLSSRSAQNPKVIAWGLRYAATRPAAGGRSESAGADAAGGAASGLEGGHAPAQSCPSARTKHPSDGLDRHDEVAAEEERRLSEDTCQGAAWRRAERSPPGTVERRNAHLGQDLSSSCHRMRASISTCTNKPGMPVASWRGAQGSPGFGR